jgi:hypothetical protein
MSVQYNLFFSAERLMTVDETEFLTKKLSRALQVNPFGPWKPGAPDHPELTTCSLHKEIDPLLGYDRRWLVNALLDHLRIQEKRIKIAGVDSKMLTDLEFTLSRIDEFAGEEVPGLDDLRAVIKRGVY